MAKEAVGPPALGLHVLFVDDDSVNRKFGSRMLTRLKCSFVCLQDGDQVGLHPPAVRLWLGLCHCLCVCVFVLLFHSTR